MSDVHRVATVFVSSPMPVIPMVTTSPAARVKSSGGTMPVPVSSTAPFGKLVSLPSQAIKSSKVRFIADTFVNDDPSADELAEIAALAVEEVQRFGMTPKVAFLSHSMFGSSQRASARKMRTARDLFVARMPDIEADGEMQGDAALSEDVRHRFLRDGTLSGPSNILILPNLDAANILFNVLKMTGGQGITVGPILLGAAAPAHVLTPSSTVRRILNMTALAVADAGAKARA